MLFIGIVMTNEFYGHEMSTNKKCVKELNAIFNA